MLVSKSKSAAALLIVAGALGFSCSVAAEETFSHTCRPGGETSTFQVEWQKWAADGDYAYAVKTIGGAPMLDGWRLQHRPADGWPNNFFAPDTVVHGSSIAGYPVWGPLIPTAWRNMPTLQATSILTCPDGGCISYPTRDPAQPNACVTIYDYAKVVGQPAPKKVSVAGDSLVLENQRCGLPASDNEPARPIPPYPDYCAKTLEAQLEDAGYRSYLESMGYIGFHSWLNVIRQQATTRPDIAVLAFGTNDAARQANAPTDAALATERSNTEQSVRAAVRALREHNPAACVVLVTAGERNGTPPSPTYRDEARRVNTLLRNTALAPELGGNVQVADFADGARRYCGDGWVAGTTPVCDWFDPDQLHLQGKGDDARNALIRDAIGRCR